MTLIRSVAWNTSVQIAGKAASTVLGLVALGLITRYLNTSGFGEYSTINAFLQFFGILIDFGLVITALSMISEPNRDHSKILSNLFTLRLFSAILFLGLAPLISLFFPYPQEIKLGIALLSFSFLFNTVNQILIAIFQKNFAMGRVMTSEIVGRLFLIGATLFAVRANTGLSGVLIAIILGSAGNMALNFILSLRFIRFGFAFDLPLWREIIRRAWPVGLSIVFNLSYLQTGTIVLSLFVPSSEVGLYGAAFRVLEVLITLPMMFMGIILPLLVDAWGRSDRAAFQERTNLAFNFLSLGAVPLAVGSFFVATPLMKALAGPNFSASGPILQILSIATSLVFVSALFTHSVVALHKQKTMLWGFSGAALFSLLGYVFLVPHFRALGAAYVTAGAELIVLVASVWIVKKTSGITPSLKILPKLLYSTLFMAIALLLLKNKPVYISIAIGAVVYVLGLFATRAIKLRTLREILWIGSRV